MTWCALWKKIGRQPLSVTQHRYVRAVIDGKAVALELKFDGKGVPYLAPDDGRDPDATC